MDGWFFWMPQRRANPAGSVILKTPVSRFFQAMLAEGVAMAPGAYETIFVGLGHTDDVLDAIIAAAHRAATSAVGG